MFTKNTTKKITVAFAIFTAIFANSLSPITTSAQTTKNIVETAISAAPEFTTLVAAVKAANLVDTLSGTGPFTVLAPTNAAFAKIPSDTLSKLLLPENKDVLSKVLTYHVIPTKVDASQIVNLTTTKTVEGSNISIAVVDGKVKLNTSTTVTKTDTLATNGIIHGIDSVLVPSTVDLSKLKSATTDNSTIRTGGISISGLSIFSILVILTGFVISTTPRFSYSKK
jgi:uncharacterized surface protein with fasciclin (FAS1) repeats